MPSATPTKLTTPNPTDLPTEITDAKGVTMRLVRAGEFTMGTDTYRGPAHQVYLDAYYMDKFEVTNALYKACVDTGVCDPPKSTGSSYRFIYYGNSEFDNYPVIHVDWSQAQTYCEWRDDSLPTEAQWEKAARGTDGRTYPWGEGIDCNKASYYADGNSCNFTFDTTEVGSYSRGASPYGIYDMAGNVWEWTADWYSDTYYQNSPSTNPPGPDSGKYRVLRGGSWYEYHMRAFERQAGIPVASGYDTGFRCARNANP